MNKELTGRTYVRPKVEKSIVIVRPLLQTVSGNAGVIGSGGSMGDAKKHYFIEEENGEDNGNLYPIRNIWEDK